MKDYEIIDLYWNRNESAITASEDKYGSYCYSISYNILHCVQDAEECVNDTWLGAWKSIPPHRPKRLPSTLFEQLNMTYKLSATNADNLTVTCCDFTCDGERTGVYVRFIFEDTKSIGEVKARLFTSECIDTLPLLALDEALVNAKRIDADGSLLAVDAADYSIKNEELVYINGLPYYQFYGYGIGFRGFINGYALAVDILASDVSEQLM